MKLFTRNKIIIAFLLIIAVAIWFGVYTSQNAPANVLTDTVRRQDLRQRVLATGQVTSETDLELSFKTSGIVDRVFAKVGQKVKAGQVLAQINQGNERASITSAQGAVAQARANYDKVLDGASSEEVMVSQRAVDAAQVTIDNAKNALITLTRQQQVLVDNSWDALLNSTITAVPEAANEGTATVTISGTYNNTKEGSYVIETYSFGAKGQRFNFNGLESGYGDVQSTPVPMGAYGLSVAMTGTAKPYKDRWIVSIPNKDAPNYVANLNAYTSAVETQKKSLADAQAQIGSAEVALAQAKASLDLKKAQARPAELAAAKAQILSAQGQLQSAQAAIENTFLRAPANGTITSVDIKVGEQASALKEVMILQDVSNLHIESNISEANIASINPGQPVDVTLDAFGPDQHYTAVVQTIDPASTVISGVVNYKVTATIDKDVNIKPGMTANMGILIADKPGVLVVPLRAIIGSNGSKMVRVITDSQRKIFEEVSVKTGLEGDGGLVEVVSGLHEGQEIVTFVEK